MKVFCNGAQMSCNGDNPVTQKINECITARADIMVSDQNYGDHEMQQYLADLGYGNVTVVILRDNDEYDEWPHENIGKWPYRLLLRSQHGFSLDPVVAFAMAEECDEGFFAWDGSDIDVFGMLAFLGYDKKISVYDPNRKDITVIDGIDDLSAYMVDDRYETKKSGVTLFHGDLVDMDILSGYAETFGEILDPMIKDKSDKLYKNDLKIMICRSDSPINTKSELVGLLAEKEDIYSELLGKVSEWKYNGGNADELKSILMKTYEHSFRNASNDLHCAMSWIDHADGSNDDIAMYLWERVERDGSYTYVPAGMYADINVALYYLEVMTSDGGKIDIWEKERGFENMVSFCHRISFYTDDTELEGFEFMRACHINDHDPFEPETYVSRNRHYMYKEGEES